MNIPENANPFPIIVNGVAKFYEAGATVTDAAAIDILGREDFPPAAPKAVPPIPLPDPGSKVVANPTLAGTEDSLTGLEVDGTKYSVGGGGGASALFITVTQTTEGTSTTETWDKTAGEIMDAMPFAYLRMDDNGVVTFRPVENVGGIGYAWSDEDGFEAKCSEGASHYVTAATRNDYPSVTWSTK